MYLFALLCVKARLCSSEHVCLSGGHPCDEIGTALNMKVDYRFVTLGLVFCVTRIPICPITWVWQDSPLILP